MKNYINEDKSIRLYNGNCLEVMDALIEKGIKVDCIVTDPPYKTISGGKGKNGDGSPSGILSKNDGKIFKHNNVKIEDYLNLFYKILKNDSQLYIMTNVLNLNKMINISQEIGFKLHNILIWEKNNCTPSRWYMKNAEYTLFLRKGKAKTINNVGSKTVHQFNNIIGNKLHPTEKPINLMELYVSNSTKEKDLILDPFMGSNPTGVACQNLNRNFIGIELDEEYYDISVNRLKGE